MDPDDITRPRRGGDDFMGPFVGGAPLDYTYQLLTDEEPFKCALQLRNAKTLLGIESQLRKTIADSTSLKYNGKLKLTLADTVPNELDKEGFLLAVDEAVLSYGLQSFFYLPDHNDDMKYLVETPHLFTITDVIDEHSSRVTEPPADLDDNDEERITSIAT